MTYSTAKLLNKALPIAIGALTVIMSVYVAAIVYIVI